jgi:hypothetical protein
MVYNRFLNNSMPIFYAGTGSNEFVRPGAFKAISQPYTHQNIDPFIQVEYNNYYCPDNNNNISTCGIVNDPFEGELFTTFAWLYGNFSSHTVDDPYSVWIEKRPQLHSKVLYLKNSNISITVQEGYWFSSHEQWKYLNLPYTDSDINNRVFRNGERARTHYSNYNNQPGLYGCLNGVADSDTDNGGYHCEGIVQIAEQSIDYFGVTTGYGAMPLFLASPNHAFVWFNTMLQANSGQNCFGITEGINITGSNIAPYVTHDTKTTTVLSMLGGIVEDVRDYMQLTGTYGSFIDAIDKEWGRIFNNNLLGEEYDFAIPSNSIPTNVGQQWTSCTSTQNYCVCPQQ